MKKITDTKILDWLDRNMENILVSRSYDPPQAYMISGQPLPKLTFQRLIRKGVAGQNIWSEREFSSLRDLATDALT